MPQRTGRRDLPLDLPQRHRDTETTEFFNFSLWSLCLCGEPRLRRPKLAGRSQHKRAEIGAGDCLLGGRGQVGPQPGAGS